MKNIIAWLVILAGIILALPLITVDLDTLLFASFNAWALVIIVIVIGVLLLNKKK